MGRRVKERAFEEKGEAVRLPSNAEVSKHRQRIIKARKELKDYNAKKRAEIRDYYDDAGNAGIDKKALKLSIQIEENHIPEDTRRMCNLYLEKDGQFSFFDTSDKDKAEDAAA